MQKLLQNFAQKQSENLLHAKKPQNYAEKQSENLLNAKKTQNYAEKFFSYFFVKNFAFSKKFRKYFR